MRRVLATILLAWLVAGCERATPPAPTPEPAATARATSELGTLTLSLSRTAMSTVEQLAVRLVLEHGSRVSASELTFEPERAGWTLAASETSRAVILGDGRVRRQWVFTLEPFLEGEYQVPQATIELRDGAETAELSTPPQPVAVTSVLAEAVHELAPLRPPVEAATARPGSVTHAVLGGAVAIVLLSGGGLWWRVRSRRAKARRSSPVEDQVDGARGQVERVRRRLRERLAVRVGAIPASATSEEMIAAARTRLNAERAARVQQLLAHLDRLSYGPGEPGDADVEAVSCELASLDLEAQEAHA